VVQLARDVVVLLGLLQELTDLAVDFAGQKVAEAEDAARLGD
jgi:hypothetical protein